MSDNLQLTILVPGAAAWLAQTNSNFQAIDAENPWIQTFKSGEALNAGEFVALDTSVATVNVVKKADSNGVNGLWNCIGKVLNTVGGAGVDVRVQMMGITIFAHASNAGVPFYLSETPGLITITPPTTPRIIALALPTNKILLSPHSSWRTT
jgi:hypothetical protein